MKSGIILDEERIRFITKDVLRRFVLKEDTEHGYDDASSITYAIMEEYEGEVYHFKEKLFQLKRMAKSENIDLNVEIERVILPARTEMGKIEDTPFVKFTITSNMPTIHVPNHKYIGSVIPVKIDYTDDDGSPVSTERGIVTLSSEFEGNDAVMRLLRNSTSVMSCDGCHRETARGIYHCFFDLSTRKVKKFGSQCAKKYFGIDISSKVYAIFNGLSELGREPYVIYDRDGFRIGKILHPVFSTLGITENFDDEIDQKMIESCMAIAKYGPLCNMKNSLVFGSGFLRIRDKCVRESYVKLPFEREEEFSPKVFSEKMEEERHNHPEIFKIYDESKSLKNEFLSNGLKFFDKFEPNSEFEEKVKNIGMLICGGAIQKKLIGKFSYVNFVPYCVSAFFKYKEKNNPDRIENQIQPIEPFTGTKIISTKIDSVDKKQTTNGNTYYQVIGITEKNELVKWFVFSEEAPDYHRGSEIRIQALYNPRYKTLDKVVEMKNNSDNEQDSYVQAQKYPEDGFRYRNAQFTILKLTPSFLVVKNNDDNGEYFISNETGGLSYYDSRVRPKFDLDKYKEGDMVTLTGTVASYQGKNGVGHKLLRVQGL